MSEQRLVLTEQDDPALPRVPGYEVFGRLDTPAQWSGRRVGADRNVLLTCLATDDWTPEVARAAIDDIASFSRLRHRHLLSVHDVIPDATDACGRATLVIATEPVVGASLASALLRRGPLTFGEAVTALVPIGQALMEMHERGLVHGGLRASVVRFTDAGMPLLGPACMHRSDAPRMPGDVPRVPEGDAATVAPEISEGFPATPHSDVYAYAALIFCALSGQKPGWVGARADLEEVVPLVSSELSRTVGRALALDPGERAELDELLADLRDLARPEPVALPLRDNAADVPRRIRAAARDADHAREHSKEHRGAHRRRRSGRAVGSRAAVVLALLAACVAVVSHVASSPALDASATTQVAGASIVKGAGASPDRPETPAAAEALSIVQALLDARAAAWVSGDPDALTMAHASGSPALATDAERLQAVAAAGTRLEGVTFSATNAEMVPAAAGVYHQEVPGAPTADADGRNRVFAMQLTVRRNAVAVLDDSGHLRTVPPASDNVTLTVVKEGQDWRLYEWH